jgi:hypothetical protein
MLQDVEDNKSKRLASASPNTSPKVRTWQLPCCLCLLSCLCCARARLSASADMHVMDTLQVVKRQHIRSPSPDTAGAMALDSAPAALAATTAAAATPSATQATRHQAATPKPRAAAAALAQTTLLPAAPGQVCGMQCEHKYVYHALRERGVAHSLLWYHVFITHNHAQSPTGNSQPAQLVAGLSEQAPSSCQSGSMASCCQSGMLWCRH